MRQPEPRVLLIILLAAFGAAGFFWRHDTKLWIPSLLVVCCLSTELAWQRLKS